MIHPRPRLSYVLVNKKPVLPGHLLVIPKRVAHRFTDLNPDDEGILVDFCRQSAHGYPLARVSSKRTWVSFCICVLKMHVRRSGNNYSALVMLIRNSKLGKCIHTCIHAKQIRKPIHFSDGIPRRFIGRVPNCCQNVVQPSQQDQLAGALFF